MYYSLGHTGYDAYGKKADWKNYEGKPMPTWNATQIPPPANWQDFESLCRDLWSRIWDDPHTQQNGREGQPQHGVDVFGRPGRGADWAGVQCKLRSQLKASRLTAEEIAEEVEKAKKFNPRLSDYVLATTATRDAKAQAAARKITQAQEAEDSFPVAVYSWNDILERLTEHEFLLAKHYPQLKLDASRPRCKTRV